MPLFGRRSRSVSVSRPMPSATSPAMLAASQAFVAHQTPQTKLATGAAAAALRSMSPASTPVSQVQTKRMLERKNSIGSPQNAQRGRPRGSNMQRRSSSGSMTERTFREPSPGRPTTSNGVPATPTVQPPVPQLPENYSNIPPIPQKSSRRSASIDETQMRARQRAGTQVPNRNSMAAMPPSRPTIDPAFAAAKRVVTGQTAPPLQREDSANSVNFSYPGRARPSSPPPQKQRPSPTEKSPKTPTTPPGISNAEARRIEFEVARTAQQPVKKKKPQVAKELVQGSHLQAGTLNTKPTVTPLAPAPVLREAQGDAQAQAVRGLNNARLTGEASHFPLTDSPTSPNSDAAAASDSDSAAVRTRRVQRASGALQKQPSVVREDWEGEQEDDEASTSPVSAVPMRIAPSKRTTTEANVSRKIEEPSPKIEGPVLTPQTAINAGVQAPSSATLAAPQAKRGSSLSPSRSTRFSKRLSADITEGQKHEPPPRSVSPMKPALKHSNSPQILAIDANRPRDSSVSPSEATDVSADGAPRPKKVAHVKFDSQPAIVGISAEPDSPASPQVVSPQYAEQTKKWFGGKPKPQPRAALQEDSDDEDAMKPRPQLPTFGSVRKGRSNGAESSSSSQKIISSPSTSSSSSSLSLTRPTTVESSVSSDQVIGALFQRQSEMDKVGVSSLEQTKATKLEGISTGLAAGNTGMTYESQNKEVTGQHSPSFIPVPTTAAADETDHMPSIAIQPATPGEEAELKHNDQWLVEIPGGFPSAYSAVTSVHEDVTLPRLMDEQQYHHERMPSIEEEDEDRASIYSDAAEDLSDVEGDGFGSINAIVRSPIAPSPGGRPSVPESPVTPTPNRDILDGPDSPASWEDAGARWKTLADTAKQSTLQPAAPIVERTVPQQGTAVKTVPSEGRKGQVKASPTTPVSPPSKVRQSPASGNTTLPAQANPPATFRKSMRADAGAAAPRTMRTGPRTSTEEVSKTMRSSMRNSGVTGPATTPAARPVVVNPPTQVKQPLPTKTTRSAAPSQPQPTVRPQPQQKPPPVNNDSDSESSFRRRRRSKMSDDSKYTMRRSMRSGETSGQTQAVSSQQRREVRSLSPVERRPFSAAGGQATMRTSMRTSMDEVPTLRNQNGGKRSSSLFARGNKPQSPSRPATSSDVRSGMRSRFADSDDEFDRRPKAFKSRFGDSSDEEDELRPVRGIPQQSRRDDSTDLEDSSDEEGRRRGKPSLATPSVAAPKTTTPAIPERPSSPMSMDGKKKRGFFGRLRSSRDESANATLKPPVPQVNGKTAAETSPSQTVDSAALGFRSDAEKDALIEQTRQKLEAAKDQERPTSPAPTGTPGKLQRRSTPQRIMSDSWPLPPKIPDDIAERPQTSSGATVTGSARPNLGERQPSSPMSNIEGGVAYGRAGKKKRFGLLRKAFGLKD